MRNNFMAPPPPPPFWRFCAPLKIITCERSEREKIVTCQLLWAKRTRQNSMPIMASEASQKILSYLGKLPPWSQHGCHWKEKLWPPYFSAYNFMTPLFSCQKTMTAPSIFGTTPHSEENDSPLIPSCKAMRFRMEKITKFKSYDICICESAKSTPPRRNKSYWPNAIPDPYMKVEPCLGIDKDDIVRRLHLHTGFALFVYYTVKVYKVQYIYKFC